MSKLGLEVLAPAGDPEIFTRVIDAGADAVYFGGSAFGARAYATNFTLESAEASIRYAHARGKKAYLTVNTLLKNLEIEKELKSRRIILKAMHIQHQHIPISFQDSVCSHNSFRRSMLSASE